MVHNHFSLLPVCDWVILRNIKSPTPTCYLLLLPTTTTIIIINNMHENTKVVNANKERYDVFIGRPSKWGNPFHIGKGVTREVAVRLFRDYILKNPALLADLHELEGKTLGCYCKPHACHGDVLKELSDDRRLHREGMLDYMIGGAGG